MATDLHPPPSERDHIQGPAGASVTLVQYGDYECPSSRRVYRIIRRLNADLENEGRYVYRHLPLSKVHPRAEAAATVVESAGRQGKFWEMHDLLFRNQSRLEDEDLIRHAESIGLNREQVAADLEARAYDERIREDKRSGVQSGVDTTSNLFINGRRYRGSINDRQVRHAIEMLTEVKLADKGEERGSADRSGDERGQVSVHRRNIRKVCAQYTEVNSEVLESVLALALEIAREGREGRKIGTLFTVGDAEGVMERSRSLVMDPFLGHSNEAKHIGRADLQETVKEFAQLDGGFVVTNEGVVRSAARYFDASTQGIELPLGLGSRHMAGASMSYHTEAIAIVVSESSMVRLFQNGRLVNEIVPELWMLRRYGLVPPKEMSRKKAGPAASDEVTVVENP